MPLIPVVRPPPPPRPPPPSHPPPIKLLQLPVPNENMALITTPITMSSKVGPSFNGRSVDNRPSWIQSTDPIRNSIGNNRSIHNKPAKLESSSIQLVGQDGANRAGRQPFVPSRTRRLFLLLLPFKYQHSFQVYRIQSQSIMRENR